MTRSRPRAAADQTLRLAWRASRPGLGVVFLFGAFINLLKLALPLYLIEVLDRVPASRSVGTLVMLTIVALLAVTAGLALEAVRRRMLARWGRWIEQHLGYILFQRRLGGARFGDTGGARIHSTTSRRCAPSSRGASPRGWTSYGRPSSCWAPTSSTRCSA